VGLPPQQQPQEWAFGLFPGQPQQQPQVGQREPNQGTVFTDQPGRSSIEKLFGGQKATPPQAQPVAAQQQSIKTEDLPKPR